MPQLLQRPALMLFLATCAAAPAARADVALNSLIADHAVLQRDRPIPVFGTGTRDGEAVTVTLGDDAAAATVKDGKWEVRLPARKASASPVELRVRGANELVVRDLLVGDVWVASGQSNMAWALGRGDTARPVEGSAEASKGADFPLIRMYKVPQRLAGRPAADARGEWLVCSPETAPAFSAVGFFFARDLQPRVGVPIGLLHSSVGGTPAESWASVEALATIPSLADGAHRVADTDFAKAKADHEAWHSANDPGSRPTGAEGSPLAWSSPDLPADGWSEGDPVTLLKDGALKDFDGIVWFRREVTLPATWDGMSGMLRLPDIDGNDEAFVNGVSVGGRDGKAASARDYSVRGGILRRGRNVIAVRVVDLGGAAGGFAKPGPGSLLRLEHRGPATRPAPVKLEGPWSYRRSTAMADFASPPPRRVEMRPQSATVLFNAMLAPLTRVPIKGVIWYQGESNRERADVYRALFPALIADWRKRWDAAFGLGDFPFLFVQVAPFKTMTPEIREAQLLTLDAAPNTAMAVTTDVGEAEDIHPLKKREVGERLALAARALAYGERVEFSGPLFAGASFDGDGAVVRFTHVGGGLVARDGALRGFTLAGADGKFVPATAKIDGDVIRVTAEGVRDAKAVRYGWASVPDVNLFNAEGLPASPFRSDAL